jgi:outer membrane protein assembly factor BamA
MATALTAAMPSRSAARSRCSAPPKCILPLPFLKDINTARVSWFVDVGNAYQSFSAFNASTLRASTGISLHWQAPIGPLIISLAHAVPHPG